MKVAAPAPMGAATGISKWLSNILTRAQRGSSQIPGIWQRASAAGVPAGQRMGNIGQYIKGHSEGEGIKDLLTLGAIGVPAGIGAYDVGSSILDRL